ncbi:MAG: PorP/SprF family type IX secretion system membrane protein [Bacteroidota bacterium]
MKKILVIRVGVFLMLNTTLLKGQDIHFSQYNFSPLNLNPALTSAYKNIQATAHHKEQWRAVNAFRTSSVTFEMKANQQNWNQVKGSRGTFQKKLKKGLAFGITVFSDKAGEGNLKTTQGNLSIAYHALINKQNTFSAGVMGGVAQRSITADGLRWNSQYINGTYSSAIVSGESFSNQSFTYGDFAAGVLWSYGDGSSYMTANDHKHFNLGFSLAHLSKPNISFLGSDKLNWKYTVHANSLIGIKNSKYSLAPSFLYLKQGDLREFTSGLLIKCKFKEESKYTGFIKSTAISLGCFYRFGDAAIPSLLIEMDKYSLGISYDANISGFKNVTYGRGGIEISLRFNSPSPFLYQNTKKSF